MAKLGTSLQDTVQFLEEHWYKKTGLITALIVTLVIVTTLLIAAEAKGWVLISALILSVLLVCAAWWISSCPKKSAKNKVGFLVSIACDDDSESKKIREDFLIPLRQLIKSGKTGSAFQFMELPQHLAKKVLEPDDAQSIRLRSRASFMLFGRVRLRTIDGQDHHIVDLNGIVAHKPVPDYVSQTLAREFSELLPRKVNISTENDLFSFQFTSEWAATVAKYIIGISAACSGDFVYAETLYKDALDQLQDKDHNFPIYEKLIERLPTRISELYEARAMVAHKAWVSNHDPSHIEELGNHLQKVEEIRKTTVPMILHLRSIHKFLKHRDVEGAISILRVIKDTNDALWNYNMAFLNAYKENLKLAIRHYRQAARHIVPPEIIAQVESFMCWVLQEEPTKVQISYCLGFFNWKIKGDKIQAKKDFTKFINTCGTEQFTKERELANQWIRDLE